MSADVGDGLAPGVEAVTLPAKAVSGGGRGYQAIALVVAAALFMQQLDGTVLTIALPTMARDLGTSATSLSLALTSYLLALALFIPASGTLADRFGSRTVFCAAIGIFLAGSLACAQAGTLPMLVAARFLQGIGGAMMVPVGRLVLLRSVAKEDLVQALSWLVMPALIGPILGPPLGGFIVTWLDWRWIFYLNLPIGIAGTIGALLLVPEVRGDACARFDTPGFLLSGVALGCLLFGFELSSRPGTGRVALALLVIGLVFGLAYVRHARRVSDPILDPRLMRINTFRLSVIGGSLTRITQGAQPFLLPLMFQLGFGLSAATTGTITMAVAIGALAMKALAPRVLRRWGFRDSLIVSGLVSSLGYAICALFHPGWSVAAMMAVLALSGFFTSFQFTGYNAIAYADVEKHQMSAATSLYATFQQLTLSLGICIAAMALELGPRLAHWEQFELGDFSLAFVIVTVISASALFWNRCFAHDAGVAMSGHQWQAAGGSSHAKGNGSSLRT
ncbi:DHA2 family efflux MFS transporter permease subunit [Sphingomonas kyeonggiensis]|uniref:EmrB/QacA subfamily drug resistance transporter n=1 Tax=Sphingomonas kyeonggiensis TaxID=1268553 RepID=A0A7W6JVQ7_9SPHN|nr:DHA2 family efflux MFS transporter permease subunit [Sphingomonas kyeonggiensis]MBB4099361.1 EmrB/QacA subfamily drug resistance transporter [Sphingomonas kyeonggiensis]